MVNANSPPGGGWNATAANTDSNAPHTTRDQRLPAVADGHRFRRMSPALEAQAGRAAQDVMHELRPKPREIGRGERLRRALDGEPERVDQGFHA